MSGFDGASILIARGGISTVSIARGCASGTGAIGALSLMNASDVHGCETCRACLACRANGFGCAYSCGSYKHTMWPAAKQSIFRVHRGSRKIGYASNLWRASL